ncbi:MAG: furin-like repeat-containing protein [archaeon]
MKKVLAILFVAIALVSSAMATCPAGQTWDRGRCVSICPAGSFYAGNDAIAYANSATTSGTVDHPSWAVGVDNNQYAEIYSTNADSYLVLDMGAGEEVWNSLDLDLKVYGDNSDDGNNKVQVSVSNNPTSGFQPVGSYDGDGDESFYIGGTTYDSIRYVKIVNTGSNRVEVDAVRGFCITNPEEPSNDVPEFGTIGALAVLGVAGFFVAKKRKN